MSGVLTDDTDEQDEVLAGHLDCLSEQRLRETCNEQEPLGTTARLGTRADVQHVEACREGDSDEEGAQMQTVLQATQRQIAQPSRPADLQRACGAEETSRLQTDGLSQQAIYDAMQGRHHQQSPERRRLPADNHRRRSVGEPATEEDDTELVYADEDASALVDVDSTSDGMQLHRHNAMFWVYPINIPERAYQVAMIQTALLHNTLVALPTGLGKTLIAAVVAYNFSRWFPQGKIVFVAPTKPLLNQQLSACYKQMSIPKEAIEEMTGGMLADRRAALWATPHKRMFFLTPQTFKNDVFRGVCPLQQVVCVVVDECHRAVGKYDIVPALRRLREEGVRFRVLGLSATPGSKKESIQEVIYNLGISRLEFRSEGDPDVVPYTHGKSIEVMEVQPTQELEDCRRLLIFAIDGLITRLRAAKAFLNYLQCGGAGLVRMQLVQMFEEKRKAEAAGHQSDPRAHSLLNQATLAVMLRDLLEMYGISAAAAMIVEKAQDAALKALRTMPEFRQFEARLDSLVARGAVHPKMARLQDVLMRHFATLQAAQTPTTATAADVAGDVAVPHPPVAPGSGRVMIFTTLRESVSSIVAMLNRHAPLITPRVFIGQGGGSRGKKSSGSSGGSSEPGMRRKEQKQVLKDFRAGIFNTLVATCIGEEGLDIPQVDMIVCYDASASPGRNIQRMGRTGRHGNGRVVYILAAGKETNKYYTSLQTAARLEGLLRKGCFEMSADSPRMLPCIINPTRLNVPRSIQSQEQQPVKKATRRTTGRSKKIATSARGARGASKASKPMPLDCDDDGSKHGEEAMQAAALATTAAAAAAAAATAKAPPSHVRKPLQQRTNLATSDECSSDHEQGAAAGPEAPAGNDRGIDQQDEVADAMRTAPFESDEASNHRPRPAQPIQPHNALSLSQQPLQHRLMPRQPLPAGTPGSPLHSDCEHRQQPSAAHHQTTHNIAKQSQTDHASNIACNQTGIQVKASGKLPDTSPEGNAVGDADGHSTDGEIEQIIAATPPSPTPADISDVTHEDRAALAAVNAHDSDLVNVTARSSSDHQDRQQLSCVAMMNNNRQNLLPQVAPMISANRPLYEIPGFGSEPPSEAVLAKHGQALQSLRVAATTAAGCALQAETPLANTTDSCNRAAAVSEVHDSRAEVAGAAAAADSRSHAACNETKPARPIAVSMQIQVPMPPSVATPCNDLDAVRPAAQMQLETRSKCSEAVRRMSDSGIGDETDEIAMLSQLPLLQRLPDRQHTVRQLPRECIADEDENLMMSQLPLLQRIPGRQTAVRRLQPVSSASMNCTAPSQLPRLQRTPDRQTVVRQLQTDGMAEDEGLSMSQVPLLQRVPDKKISRKSRAGIANAVNTTNSSPTTTAMTIAGNGTGVAYSKTHAASSHCKVSAPEPGPGQAHTRNLQHMSLASPHGPHGAHKNLQDSPALLDMPLSQRKQHAAIAMSSPVLPQPTFSCFTASSKGCRPVANADRAAQWAISDQGLETPPQQTANAAQSLQQSTQQPLPHQWHPQPDNASWYPPCYHVHQLRQHDYEVLASEAAAPQPSKQTSHAGTNVHTSIRAEAENDVQLSQVPLLTRAADMHRQQPICHYSRRTPSPTPLQPLANGCSRTPHITKKAVNHVNHIAPSPPHIDGPSRTVALDEQPLRKRQRTLSQSPNGNGSENPTASHDYRAQQCPVSSAAMPDMTGMLTPPISHACTLPRVSRQTPELSLQQQQQAKGEQQHGKQETKAGDMGNRKSSSSSISPGESNSNSNSMEFRKVKRAPDPEAVREDAEEDLPLSARHQRRRSGSCDTAKTQVAPANVPSPVQDYIQWRWQQHAQQQQQTQQQQQQQTQQQTQQHIQQQQQQQKTQQKTQQQTQQQQQKQQQQQRQQAQQTQSGTQQQQSPKQQYGQQLQSCTAHTSGWQQQAGNQRQQTATEHHLAQQHLTSLEPKSEHAPNTAAGMSSLSMLPQADNATCQVPSLAFAACRPPVFRNVLHSAEHPGLPANAASGCVIAPFPGQVLQSPPGRPQSHQQASSTLTPPGRVTSSCSGRILQPQHAQQPQLCQQVISAAVPPAVVNSGVFADDSDEDDALWDMPQASCAQPQQQRQWQSQQQQVEQQQQQQQQQQDDEKEQQNVQHRHQQQPEELHSHRPKTDHQQQQQLHLTPPCNSPVPTDACGPTQIDTNDRHVTPGPKSLEPRGHPGAVAAAVVATPATSPPLFASPCDPPGTASCQGHTPPSSTAVEPQTRHATAAATETSPTARTCSARVVQGGRVPMGPPPPRQHGSFTPAGSRQQSTHRDSASACSTDRPSSGAQQSTSHSQQHGTPDGRPRPGSAPWSAASSSGTDSSGAKSSKGKHGSNEKCDVSDRPSFAGFQTPTANRPSSLKGGLLSTESPIVRVQRRRGALLLSHSGDEATPVRQAVGHSQPHTQLPTIQCTDMSSGQGRADVAAPSKRPGAAAVQFIDWEAECSDDDVSGDEDEDGPDNYEADFIKEQATQLPNRSPGADFAMYRTLLPSPAGNDSTARRPKPFGHRPHFDRQEKRHHPPRRQQWWQDGAPGQGSSPPRSWQPQGLQGGVCTGGMASQYDMSDGFMAPDDDSEDGASGEHGSEKDPNNDFCDRCGGAGDLLCCDTCPSAFHLRCVGFSDVPEGEWRCASCTSHPRREV